MAKHDSREPDHDLIVDRIYQIALQPSSLDDFIDFWHDSDLINRFNDTEDREFDQPYKTHLQRAQSILQSHETGQPNFADYLRPYRNLAAFVVSGLLDVEAANAGAEAAFGVKTGDRLDQLSLPPELQAALIETTREVLHSPKTSERLLKVEMAAKAGTMLFRVMRVADAIDGYAAALIVTSHFHWQESFAVTLGKVFQLTVAEQDVTRLLVEGKDTKSIATFRNTSEGTTRGQIKSIISKMNLRSQTDVVRLVMTLGEFPKLAAEEEEAAKINPPKRSNNWLEKEVWKPFKSIVLPDGRTLTYHDMGPKTGNPVLLSHMGSCMVRWSSQMVQRAFERNLRVICPIRAGYGFSDNLDLKADPFDATRQDTLFLLRNLGLSRLPYAIHGSDFPLAVDMIAEHPGLVSELIGIGARPCLPGGRSIEGAGRWQRFFVAAARNAPHLALFTSQAVMAMCKRVGSEAMLKQLCKDSRSDLALLEDEEVKRVLVANLNLMAGKSTNAARAFAMEYIAFQQDWSHRVAATRDIPVHIFLAEEDPTIDLGELPELQKAYPWIKYEVMEKAGLALMYQKHERLIPIMADAARRAVHHLQ